MEKKKVESKKQLKIPKAFKLFATTIKVIFDNVFCNEKECYGYARYSESNIMLANTYGVLELSDDKIMDTFYHEKVHMILDTMGEHELSDNEKFVDTFGKLLRQSDETAEYGQDDNN